MSVLASPAAAPAARPPAATGAGTGAGFGAAELEDWITQHHRQFAAFALALCRCRATADDLVQESLLEAWRLRARFDPQRGTLGVWLRGILRNKWRTHARRQRLEFVDAATLEALEGIHRSWEEGESAGPALFARLGECVEKLPEPQRDAVQATYRDGLDGSQLAARLGAAETTLRKRLQRARQALRACLERGSAPNR